MKSIKHLVPIAALAAAVLPAAAAEIRCAGVLANSGESGDTLVKTYVGEFPAGGAPSAGAGVVVDDAGAIWCRGADGVLLKLAADGRFLASYVIPKYGSNDGWDQVSRAGDFIVMRVHGQVATLPLDAAPGSSAAVLPGVRADRISYSSTADGRVALYAQGRLALLNPATGECQPAGETGDIKPHSIEVEPDGAILVVGNGRIFRFVDGARADGDGWPRPMPGDRPRRLDGWWWSSAWHGTLKRNDMALSPAPGVVLGGNSGSFIGHLDENPDVNNYTGMDLLKPGTYVAVGGTGIAQTLDWDSTEACLKIRRRIGALADCPGLAIDSKGRIFCGTTAGSGNWEWSDTPVTPIRHGVPPYIAGQGCIVNDWLVAPCWVYSTRPSLFVGALSGEVSSVGLPGDAAFSRKIAALAVWRDKKTNWALIAESDGTAHATRLDGALKPAKDGAIQMELSFAEQPKRLTALAIRPAANESECDTLFAAVDGAVVELVRSSTGFREVSRWSAWGSAADARFGGEIHLYAHSGRLWVADTERARILVFDAYSGASAPLAQFGATDAPGASLKTLDRPTQIAAHGDRAVVYDAANQRLVKFTFAR